MPLSSGLVVSAWLLREGKYERHLDELLHLPAAELRREETVVRKHVADGAREELMVGLHDLEGLHVGATGRVDDELGDDLSLDVRRAELVRICRRLIARIRRGRL